MFWPHVDGFIRAAVEEIDLPSDFMSDIDFELRVLMAVFNAPTVSKNLEAWKTKEARINALVKLSDRELERKMVEVTQTMRSMLGTRTNDMRVVRAFGNFMRKSYEFYCEELRRRELEVAHLIANPK